jgi:hypothetical protein
LRFDLTKILTSARLLAGTTHDIYILPFVKDFGVHIRRIYSISQAICGRRGDRIVLIFCADMVTFHL